jgi:hypothetical protein
MKHMSRTRKDITIKGRTIEEVKTAVELWFGDNSVELIENSPTFIKGRWGTGILTAAKYFQVAFTQTEEGVIAKTEGWIKPFWVSEQELSPTALMGAVPKREGYAQMERLWGILKELAKTP